MTRTTNADSSEFEPSHWIPSHAPGMGFGWEGQAWIFLQAARAGLVPFEADASRALTRSIQKALRKPLDRYCGAWQGDGATALIAGLAATLDSSLRPLAKESVRRWQMSARASSMYDYMGGRAGALVTCTELERAAPGHVPVSFARTLHRDTLERLQTLLDISRDSPVYLGFTHGIVGFLFALECAKHTLGLDVPRKTVEGALNLLVSEGYADEDGAIFWKNINHDNHVSMNGWCHGAPGIALGLMIARQLSNNDAYERLVRGALRAAASIEGENLTYCCGKIGRAQILVEAHRAKRRGPFLSRATLIADDVRRQAEAPGGSERFEPAGFYKSRLGLTYLDLRLRDPQRLPLPGLGAWSAISPRVERSSP